MRRQIRGERIRRTPGRDNSADGSGVAFASREGETGTTELIVARSTAEPPNVFVITPETNKMHTLNRTAAAIWRLASEGCTLDQVASHLHQHFEVDLPVAQRDAGSCCEDLVRRGILVCQ